MLNTVTMILGAVATIVCIFGYILALDVNHKYQSLWAYCASACLYVIAACWGIQQSWLESAKPKEPPLSESPSKVPIVFTSADFPHGALATEIKEAVNSTAQNGGINAPNNQGIINTGTNSGTISQTVNVNSPLPRVVPRNLESDLKPLAGSSLGILEIWNNDSDDVKSLSSQVIDVLKATNITFTRSKIGMDSDGTSNIHVFVKDLQKPSDLALALVKAFSLKQVEQSGYSSMFQEETVLVIAARK